MLKNLFGKKVVINHEEQFAEWIRNGKTIPPPHIVKQKKIEEYGIKFNLSTLIETGTYQGDMVEAQKQNFKSIISIELSDKLFKKAKTKFENQKHISILQGDSGKLLSEVVKKLNAPALFWLDGHYSGGITALGDKECPVPEELAAIFSINFNHIILIDDARLFNGTHDYPTYDEIKTIVQKFRKNYQLEIIDDIICLTPQNH